MLIDASHAEETRVVVLDGSRLEDFDVETSTKKQLKGNIYLAKVVRVEPSLQAAFVEYGGGRHGFLAFSEIHPDYYQIPIADRERLLAMQAEEARDEDEDEEPAAPPPPRRRGEQDDAPLAAAPAVTPEPLSEEAAQATEAPAPTEPAPVEPPEASEATATAEPAAEPAPEARVEAPEATALPAAEPAAAPVEPEPAQPASDDNGTDAPIAAAPEAPAPDDITEARPPRAQPASMPHDVRYGEFGVGEASLGEIPPAPVVSGEEPASEPAPAEAADVEEPDEAEPIPHLPPPETIGGDGGDADAAEEVTPRRTARFLRNYRIQEVIRRRQIMLVQVVKEERGTKGAALTTYISLAGRYCVLMPNSPRGGGISRKITSAADRKRLKEITAELDIPQGMGLIVRTAGANRPKPEIKRDCEYLMRLWDDIREHTLRSVAPALIYEEASLIKRAIRDVYSRDIEEILVDGEDAWRAAHDFMRMLMPSHARKVQLWRPNSYEGGGQPLFSRHQVEAQLDAMVSPTVQLRSGGYLVINQTEALVAIDVNSGRSTRERGIEETALRTNLEAADEVARQLRLRDLAGLIVIDFIDMESKKNNASVERRLKEALKTDRARIQVGHISHFGLLEMSRQRLRPSLAETSFITCPHCNGLGQVRSVESSALHVLRAIEDEGARARASLVMVHVASQVIMYILNNKRERLAEIEQRTGMRVQFAADETLVPPQVRVEKLRGPVIEAERPAPAVIPVAPAPLPEPADVEETLIEVEEAEVIVEAAESAAPERNGDESERRRRRRRRRRRGGRDAAGNGVVSGEETEDGDESDEEPFPIEGAEQPDIPIGAFPVVPEQPESLRQFAPVDIPEPAGVTEPSDVAEVAEIPEAAEAVEVAAPAEQVAAPEPVEAEPAEPVAPPQSAEPAAAAERPEAAPTEESEEEGDANRRRRGRRGGRRRRRDGTTEGEAEAPQAAPAPAAAAWSGPTPADPFAGHTYDIFDLIEQQEHAQQAPRPAPVAAPDDAGAEQPAEPEAPPPAIEAPAPEPEAAVVAPEPEAEAEAAPAPSEPVVGSAVKPVIIGQDTVPVTERKRGWWKR